MPRTTPDPPSYLERHLGGQAAQVAALAQRQTFQVVDSSQATTDTSTGTTTPGPVVLNVGQIPSGMPTTNPRWQSDSQPIYGVEVESTVSGKTVMHYGSQTDGTHGLWSLDDNGKVVLKTGEIVDSPVFAGTLYGTALYTSAGDLIALFGQLPSGDYGVAIFNPSTGNLVGQFGELPDGNTGLGFFSSGGTEQLELNANGLEVFNGSSDLILQVGKPGGKPALVVQDTSGNLRLQAGELPSGDYGLLVQDAQGTPVTREILPIYSDFVNSTLSTSSASYVSIAGSPTVTAILGNSGDAKVTVAAFIGPTASNASGSIALNIDGTTDTDPWCEVSNSGTPIAVSASTIRPLSKTTFGTIGSGSHTFGLRYLSSSGSTNFSALCLIVEPI